MFLSRKIRGADSKEFSFTVRHFHPCVEIFNALLEEDKKKSTCNKR
jgi:hypothetical protein